MNRIIKKIWITAAILVILAAVFSSVFRSLTPWAKQYKGDVEHHLTAFLGQPVTIHSMETGWYWFQPVLKLKQITVQDGTNDALHLDRLLVGINLFKSLWYWRIQPGVLYIDGINLVFTQHDGQWKINGLKNAGTNKKMTPERTHELMGWLSQQERLIIKNVSAHFHFSDGGLIPVSGLNLSVVNHSGHYKLKGDAALDQTSSSFLELLGDLYFDHNHLDYTKGTIYFSAKHIVLAQWQSLFPQTSQQLEGGKGDIALWIDLDKGAPSLVQAQVKLKRLAWRLLNSKINKKSSELIQAFAANLSWKPDNKGWQFNADRIKLRIAEVAWPENKVLVRFDKAQQSYQLFVKSIIIESLLSEAVNWPAAIQNLLPYKPHGVLSDTQVVIKDQTVSYFLSRFEQLGWLGRENIPQVDNISGALNWQPTEGHLELDSQSMSFTAKGYPVQNLAILNGGFDWKELANGLRISIEHFVLSKPDLTISAQGVIDDVSAHSVGNIRLNADFSGKNIQQWMAYLPKQKMKPKLYAWLNNDVKRIAQATGKVSVNGLGKDFPFDNNNGEFSITSHAVGGDILITPKWQLVKDIEGYIKVKNRNLDIDIVRGDFNGVPLKEMNLRIDDIGKDKETLLIRGVMNGQADKMLDFVMHSPLSQKLTTLKMLALKGMLLLKLQLEIPLYPENDDNLAQGELTFKKNLIQVKHKMGVINVEDVTGDLSFDEKGVTHSALAATALGYPLQVKIQSVKTPKPATTILINGECTVESLKSHFNAPLLAVLKGTFVVEALFNIPDNPADLELLNIKSSLEGVAVDLPEPLGKAFADKVPLEVNFDYNAQKSLRLRANYTGRMSTDILFKETKDGFDLDSGQILVGSGQAVNQNKPGLAVVGVFERLNLEAWKKVMLQFGSSTTSSPLLTKLRTINVTLGKLTFMKQSFDHMEITATTQPNNNWSFNLNQQKIAGDLNYHPATNEIGGLIRYLHLTSFANSAATSDVPSVISPGQIPNLNLRIDDLAIDNKKIGNVTLKTKSTSERLGIDYCRIESPFYQFAITGEWNKKDKVNQSKMQVKMELTDLAKSLDQWQITPVVSASKGAMEFRGGWSGSFADFSLQRLNGVMYLMLKNGRITHLSPETEEKLGLGKLLSILSLQTIPRRLKLDFSDLSHQGYSFDIFKGDFAIKNGIMNTQNSYIDGPVAYASMKGDLDLVRRLYDLSLKISPHITASLPIVATIAGGPVAGIAAWVASKIINQGMQKITAYSYKVSGPWNEPVVQQLSIVRHQ